MAKVARFSTDHCGVKLRSCLAGLFVCALFLTVSGPVMADTIVCLAEPAPSDVTLPRSTLSMLCPFLGGSVSTGAGDIDYSSNPGNQTIKAGAGTGGNVRVGVLMPFGRNFAVSAAGTYGERKFDHKRLINPGGGFINIGGETEIQTLGGEVSLHLKVAKKVTASVSFAAGRVDRETNITVAGVPVVKFSDTGGYTGGSVGLGVMVLPNVCINGSVGFRNYDGVNGTTLAGAPIRFGGFDENYARMGITFRMNRLLSYNSQAVTVVNIPTPFCP